MNRTIAIAHIDDGFCAHLVGVNLAISLVSSSKQSTALIDASFSGQTATDIYLSGTASRHLSEVSALLSSLDDSLFSGYLTRHHSGVYVMGGENDSEKGSIIPKTLEMIVSRTGSVFPVTVVIAPDIQGEHLLSVLMQSCCVIVPVMPHLRSLKRAKEFLNNLSAAHFPLSFARIILRKAETTHGLSCSAVRDFLNTEVYSELELDQENMIASINSGEPAILKDPSGSFAAGTRRLADQLLREDPISVLQRRVVSDPQCPAKQHDISAIKGTIRRELMQLIDPKIMEASCARETDIRNNIKETLQGILARYPGQLSREEREMIIEELLNEVLGLGCLEPLLRDQEVSEIMVNGTDTVYIEKEGRISRTGAAFSSESQLMAVIDRIVLPLGRRVDQASPIVDARLPDGSRVNAVIPPLSLSGPLLTIRKFHQNKMGIKDLVRIGAMTGPMADFLAACVKARKNMLISGGTGSGKTTLLNSLANFIPPNERIITIEDAAELQLPQEHVVRLEARPPSIEGTGAIPIRRLVINALRMRPDRIIVGECRGGEALDMLQAMNTGHDGSLTTLHANSTKDSISRIITMALMAEASLSEKAIREQATAALQIIVQLSRLSDGSRKLVEIAELYDHKDGSFELVPLFDFKQSGVRDGKATGEFRTTGNIPSFFDDLEPLGIALDKGIFKKEI